MTYKNHGRPLQFLGTLRLAFCIDTITTRDWPDSIAQAVREGYVLFAELLFRRSTMPLSQEDAKLMEWVLDGIRGKPEIPGALRTSPQPAELTPVCRTTATVGCAAASTVRRTR